MHTLLALKQFFKKPITDFYDEDYEQIMIPQTEVKAENQELKHQIELLKTEVRHEDELISVYRQFAC